MTNRLLTALVFSLCLAAPLAADDWARFLGPNADGFAPDKGINKAWNQKPPKALWQVALTDAGYSGPSVAGGKVYIVDHQGDQDVVRALDFRTGTEIWRYAYDEALKNDHGFARCTPTVEGGRVYTLARSGQTHCLDAASGKLVWARNIMADFGGKQPRWQMSMSIFIDGGKAIVVPGGKDAAVVALDKSTGKTIWAGGGSDAPGYATPQVATINGKRQYVIFTAASVMGVDPDKGGVLWSFPWPIRNGVNAAMPIVMGNKVFITSNYGMGCALVEVTPDGAREVWKSEAFQSRFSTPILTGGHLYCTGETRSLVCLEPQTGTIKWQQPGFEWGGLIAVDGVLIVADGKDGHIVMVKPNPEAYEELGRFRPLGGRTWTAPIIADGKLLVRNHTTLACYDLN